MFGFWENKFSGICFSFSGWWRCWYWFLAVHHFLSTGKRKTDVRTAELLHVRWNRWHRRLNEKFSGVDMIYHSRSHMRYLDSLARDTSRYFCIGWILWKTGNFPDNKATGRRYSPKLPNHCSPVPSEKYGYRQEYSLLGMWKVLQFRDLYPKLLDKLMEALKEITVPGTVCRWAGESGLWQFYYCEA